MIPAKYVLQTLPPQGGHDDTVQLAAKHHVVGLQWTYMPVRLTGNKLMPAVNAVTAAAVWIPDVASCYGGDADAH